MSRPQKTRMRDPKFPANYEAMQKLKRFSDEELRYRTRHAAARTREKIEALIAERSRR